MSRSLVFVNANSETLTINSDGPLAIVTVDGLGTPETVMQEQKAPFQDGTTFIDALFQPRTITVEVAITKPNDFASIDLYRRELVRKLNPKLGPGTLTYTTENGASFKIAAVPISSPAFPNKDYRDPYARAQVTFYCNDPYWKKTTADTINLPAITNGASVNIRATAIDSRISAIKDSRGIYMVLSTTKSTHYLVLSVSATAAAGSWTDYTINSAACSVVAIVQSAASEWRVFYKVTSTGYLAERKSIDGTTFGAEESAFADTTTANKTAVIKSNGLYPYRKIISINGATDYIKRQEYNPDSPAWSGAVTIVTAASNKIGNINYYQDPSGIYFVSYEHTTDGLYIMKSTDGITYGDPVLVVDYANEPGAHGLVRLSSGDLLLTVFMASPGYLYQYTSTDDGVTWMYAGTVAAGAGVGSSIPLIEAGVGFRYVFNDGATEYPVTIPRVVTPTTATITGDYKTPLQVSFNGPSTNPRIVNADTLEYIRLNTTLATGDTFTVDTTFGNKTVTLTQGGIVKNGIAFLDIGSTFFQLEPGANVVYFEDDAVASTATATMTWTERYVGT